MSDQLFPLPPAADALAGHFKRRSLSPETVAGCAAVLDFLVVAHAAWFGWFASSVEADFAAGKTTLIALLGGVATCLLGMAARQYRLAALRHHWPAMPIVSAGAAVGVMLAGMLHPVAPASTILWVAGLCALGLAVIRALVTVPLVRWISDTGLTERRAVLLGGGAPAQDLIDGLRRNPDNDIRICAIFDDRSADRSPDMILNVPKIGRFEHLLSFARRAEIDLVIIALPLEAADRIAGLLDQFRVLPLPVHLAQFSKDYQFDSRGLAPGDANLSLLAKESFGLRRRIVKRGFDVLLASAILCLLAPVMALIALAIRLDSPGPVLFRQQRSGFNEKSVNIFKFRSMHVQSCDPTARAIVLKNDPRVTRVGAFLRKSSLDELPQLFNVLRGDLSLVGPRPHVIDAVTERKEAFADLVAGYSARHRLPPGITGWAQIHGFRGGIDAPEALENRVAHDLWYIENWSIWLDLRILLRTPLSLVNTRNAY